MLYLADQLMTLTAEGQQSKQDPDLFLLSLKVDRFSW